MVIDTSALIAILLNEPGGDRLIDAMSDDPVRLISAVNALETAVVIEARKQEQGGREFDLLLHRAKIDVVPFTQEHVEEARIAWRTFGEGNHPAGLNFCDCCAYALSKISGEPLLFKGADFSKTDAQPALREEVRTPTLVLTLHKALYNQGFFNVPVDFDLFFGSHNSPIEIYIEDSQSPIVGTINRTAQRNGTPRIMGHTALRDYFRLECTEGDVLDVVIESPQRIRIRRRT
jgi:ribonuclease VapC